MGSASASSCWVHELLGLMAGTSGGLVTPSTEGFPSSAAFSYQHNWIRGTKSTEISGGEGFLLPDLTEKWQTLGMGGSWVKTGQRGSSLTCT